MEDNEEVPVLDALQLQVEQYRRMWSADPDLCMADEFPPPHLTPVGQHVYGSWTGTAYPSHVHKFKGIVVGREPCPALGDPCPEECTVVHDYFTSAVRRYTLELHWCPVHAVARSQAIEHE